MDKEQAIQVLSREGYCLKHFKKLWVQGELCPECRRENTEAFLAKVRAREEETKEALLVLGVKPKTNPDSFWETTKWAARHATEQFFAPFKRSSK